MGENIFRFCLFEQLINKLPNLNEKCKEVPLSRMYSVKARAILHAHLGRIALNPETLEKDRQLIVQKCPYLIQEMVSCVNQLIMLAYARRSMCSDFFEIVSNFLNSIFCSSSQIAENRNNRKLYETIADDFATTVGIQKSIASATIHNRRQYSDVQQSEYQKFTTIGKIERR